MKRDFNKIDECVYPYTFGCRDCEHSKAPELFDGGCDLIPTNGFLEQSVDYEYVVQVIEKLRKEFWGFGVTDETFIKVMTVLKLARHILKKEKENE